MSGSIDSGIDSKEVLIAKQRHASAGRHIKAHLIYATSP